MLRRVDCSSVKPFSQEREGAHKGLLFGQSNQTPC